MPIEKLFTFICFGLWLTGTIFCLCFAVFKHREFAQAMSEKKLTRYRVFDIVMVNTIVAWLSMWVFRTMY